MPMQFDERFRLAGAEADSTSCGDDDSGGAHNAFSYIANANGARRGCLSKNKRARRRARPFIRIR